MRRDVLWISGICAALCQIVPPVPFAFEEIDFVGAIALTFNDRIRVARYTCPVICNSFGVTTVGFARAEIEAPVHFVFEKIQFVIRKFMSC